MNNNWPISTPTLSALIAQRDVGARHFAATGGRLQRESGIVRQHAQRLRVAVRAFDAHQHVGGAAREPVDADALTVEPAVAAHRPALDERIGGELRARCDDDFDVVRHPHVQRQAPIGALRGHLPQHVPAFRAGLAQFQVRGPESVRRRIQRRQQHDQHHGEAPQRTSSPDGTPSACPPAGRSIVTR